MKSKPKQITAAATRKLIALRKELNLTKKQMAEKLEMTFGGYSKYERGEAIPGVRTLNIIINKFGVSVDWLIFDKGPKFIVDQSRVSQLEKEVEQLKTALDNQRKDCDTRLEEKNKKVESLEHQLKQNENQEPEVFKKPGIAELLDLVEKNRVFYHKLMLYVEDFKNQEK